MAGPYQAKGVRAIWLKRGTVRNFVVTALLQLAACLVAGRGLLSEPLAVAVRQDLYTYRGHAFAEDPELFRRRLG
jgi:hypothetical protein